MPGAQTGLDGVVDGVAPVERLAVREAGEAETREAEAEAEAGETEGALVGDVETGDTEVLDDCAEEEGSSASSSSAAYTRRGSIAALGEAWCIR